VLTDGVFRSHFDRRSFEKSVRFLLHRQQRSRFALQRLVTQAGLAEKGIALRRRAL
jgi:hypothetical protein